MGATGLSLRRFELFIGHSSILEVPLCVQIPMEYSTGIARTRDELQMAGPGERRRWGVISLATRWSYSRRRAPIMVLLFGSRYSTKWLLTMYAKLVLKCTTRQENAYMPRLTLHETRTERHLDDQWLVEVLRASCINDWCPSQLCHFAVCRVLFTRFTN